MKILASTDADALLVIGALLKFRDGCYMVVDRKWFSDGTATHQVYISIDCSPDEHANIMEACVDVEAGFRVVVEP